MKEHLKTCVPYLEDISNVGSWIVDEHNRKRQKSDTGVVIGLGGRKRQATLDVPRLSRQDQDETSRLAAMALYRTGKSFNTFEDEGWAAWCHKMNPAWKIPSAKLFGGVLLDEIYGKMKIDVHAAVDTCTYLNYVTDGSSNISHERIVNLSVHTQMGVFQLESEEIPAIKHSAPELAKWAHAKAIFWSRGQTQRHNSWATDTASVMRAFWREMGQLPEWKHTLFVPCDSHGLQLLMKHISELSWFKDVFKRAQHVVSYFHKAEKQLALLREEQVAMYNGKTYALTLSVITRWGTQYRLIHSLLQSKDALRRYGTRDDLDYEKSDEGKGSHSKMIESITNRNFWYDLEDLIEIYKPFHDCQIMSESGDVYFSYFIKRWKTIELYLQSLHNCVGFQQSHKVDNIFLSRQTTSGHQAKPI